MKRVRVLVLAVGAWSCAAFSQAVPAGNFTPVRAQLLRGIHAAQLMVGETFLLKTSAEWQGNGCTVRKDTLVTARVSTLETAARPTSLGVRFDPVPCSESERGAVRPLLIALQAEHAVPDDSLGRLSTAGSEASAISSLFSPSRPGMPTSSDTMLTSANVVATTSYAGYTRAPEVPLVTGEVRGLRGVSMQLPSGSAETKLSTRARNISVEKYAAFLLLLVPVPAGPLASASVDQRATETRTAITPRPPTEEPADACPAKSCVALQAASADGPQATAAWTVSLAPFGLSPRPTKQIVDFEQTASILPLGSDQVLVTFDPHTLVPRGHAFAGVLWHPRNVRAVVLSRSTGQVLSVRNWVAADDLAPPVWSLGDGKVVAHVGSSLVLYGSGLQELGRYSLPGPLLFLSAATPGNLLLAATVHERHTAADHEKYATVLSPGEAIPEDYDLTGLTGALTPTGTRRIAVEPVKPALVADALVTATRARGDSWQVESSTWAGSHNTLARLRSGCDVHLTALSGQLLLARGCPRNESAERWFDVVDEHGKVILKGETAFGDMLQQTETDSNGKLIAVAISHFDKAVRRGDRLNVRDFQNLGLTVYSVGTGKPVFATHLPSGSSQQQTFALAPDATSLTVLTGDTVQNILISRPLVSGLAASAPPASPSGARQ